jgi:hypothetical protein
MDHIQMTCSNAANPSQAIALWEFHRFLGKLSFSIVIPANVRKATGGGIYPLPVVNN